MILFLECKDGSTRENLLIRQSQFISIYLLTYLSICLITYLCNNNKNIHEIEKHQSRDSDYICEERKKIRFGRNTQRSINLKYMFFFN